tara:strand:+ start:175 stop:462 length:288 start_codon:yes stop_codon:yes gene_type:complete
MNQYRVIVTELHSAEYHVDARTESEAHTLVINGLAGEPVESWYNETMDDVEDAYIVTMQEDDTNYSAKGETQIITAGDKKLKEYLERQEFFNDTE